MKTERSKGKEVLSNGKTVLKRGRKTFDRTGEIAYMNAILSCVDRRRKLLGLSDRDRGDGVDIQVHAVEVVVHSRKQAKSMVEYEEFRKSVRQRGNY